jgi:hypothetical protein
MAKHLDLEEQEQLDELKHFWKTYGNLDHVVALIVVLGARLPGGMPISTGKRISATSRQQPFLTKWSARSSAGDLTRLERSFGRHEGQSLGVRRTHCQAALFGDR